MGFGGGGAAETSSLESMFLFFLPSSPACWSKTERSLIHLSSLTGQLNLKIINK